MTNVNWDNNAIKVANLKNNDVFYVICNRQILAVKIVDSYIKFNDSYGAILYCKGKTPLGNTFFDSNIFCIYVNRDDNSKLYSWSPNTYNRYDIYERVEDAQNNIVSKNTITLSSLPILHDNFEYALYIPHGCDDELRAYYYTYEKSTYAIRQSFTSIYTLKRTDNGLVFSSKFEAYKFSCFGSKEAVREFILNERAKLSVVSFDDEETKPTKEKVTISLDVDPDMPLKEIAELLYAKLHA